MKFFYNDKLVRTSRNHVYTHAVLDDQGRCAGCRTSREAAEGIIRSALHQAQESIENSKRHMKAIEAGQKRYKYVEGRRTYYLPVEPGDTVERCQSWIEAKLERIDYIKSNWRVVELEAR